MSKRRQLDEPIFRPLDKEEAAAMDAAMERERAFTTERYAYFEQAFGPFFTTLSEKIAALVPGNSTFQSTFEQTTTAPPKFPRAEMQLTATWNQTHSDGTELQSAVSISISCNNGKEMLVCQATLSSEWKSRFKIHPTLYDEIYSDTRVEEFFATENGNFTPRTEEQDREEYNRVLTIVELFLEKNLLKMDGDVRVGDSRSIDDLLFEYLARVKKDF